MRWMTWLVALMSMVGVAMASSTQTAIFAGGCFWCMQPPFDKLKGVLGTKAGYIGGTQPNPTYEQVSSGRTQYAEAVQVTYDPNQISYAQLLEVFWHNIDPTVGDRQFCDVGKQYRPGIFYLTPEQKKTAEAAKAALAQSGRFNTPIKVEITQAGTFYPAEDYHQDYYKKNPIRYKFYRYNCGRDKRLKMLWR